MYAFFDNKSLYNLFITLNNSFNISDLIFFKLPHFITKRVKPIKCNVVSINQSLKQDDDDAYLKITKKISIFLCY